MRNYYIFVIFLGLLVISLVIVGFIVGGTPVAQKNVQYQESFNPAKQFAEANNTQRRSDINAILNAISQYAADNNGTLPTGAPAVGETKNITSAETGSAFCTALVPTYIATLPKDPTKGTFTDCNSYDTGYQISVSAHASGGTPQVTMSAPNAEIDATISTTR